VTALAVGGYNCPESTACACSKGRTTLEKNELKPTLSPKVPLIVMLKTDLCGLDFTFTLDYTGGSGHTLKVSQIDESTGLEVKLKNPNIIYTSNRLKTEPLKIDCPYGSFTWLKVKLSTLSATIDIRNLFIEVEKCEETSWTEWTKCIKGDKEGWGTTTRTRIGITHDSENFKSCNFLRSVANCAYSTLSVPQVVISPGSLDLLPGSTSDLAIALTTPPDVSLAAGQDVYLYKEPYTLVTLNCTEPSENKLIIEPSVMLFKTSTWNEIKIISVEVPSELTIRPGLIVKTKVECTVRSPDAWYNNLESVSVLVSIPGPKREPISKEKPVREKKGWLQWWMTNYKKISVYFVLPAVSVCLVLRFVVGICQVRRARKGLDEIVYQLYVNK